MHNGNALGLASRFGRQGSVLLAISATVLMLAACPLPYEFSGGNGVGGLSRDPSSPDVTPPVTFSYQQVGGSGGTVENGSTTIATSNDTTITLTTSMPNATIFFTDDGTPLTSLSGAQSFSGSSGQLVLRIADPSPTNRIREKQIRAVAVAPGMRPSPLRELIATVTYEFNPRAIVSSVPQPPSSAAQASRREVLRALRIEVEIETLTLDEITMVLDGSHAPLDIRRLQLWRGTSSTFDDNAALVQTQFRAGGFAAGAPASFSFSGNNGRFDPGVHYLFLTATIDPAAIIGNTVFAASTPLSALGDFGEHVLAGTDPLDAGPIRTVVGGSHTMNLVSEDFARNIRFEFNNVRINGVPVNTQFVGVGTSVSVFFDLRVSQAGSISGSPIVQQYVGVHGLAGTCAIEFVFQDGGNPQTYPETSFTFTPTSPGIYYVSMGASLEFSCLPNPATRVRYFDAERNFAVIIAQ